MQKIFIIFILLLKSNFAFSQTPAITMLNCFYNYSNNYYEVRLKTNQISNFSLGTSVISIILPSTELNQALVIESINGGSWGDSNRSYDIGAKDYHGIVTNGQSNISYTADTSIILFRFKLSGACKEGVRLWQNNLDLAETPDGTEYVNNLYFPAYNDYSLPTPYGVLPFCNNPNFFCLPMTSNRN